MPIYAPTLPPRPEMGAGQHPVRVLIGLRHLAVGLSDVELLAAGTANRLQSLFASFGFICLATALQRIFPKQLPARLGFFVFLGLLPNLFRNFVLQPGELDEILHDIANLVYLLTGAWIILAAHRARVAGDPVARRLFLGLIGVFIPLAVEVVAIAVFQVRLRISGFSMVALAVSIGASWQWFSDHSLRTEILEAREEAGIWRALIPQPTWRSGEASEFMTSTFGTAWPSKLADRMQTPDGALYRTHRASLPNGEMAGWCEPWEETLPGTGFLVGWTVAVAMDDAGEAQQVARWLRHWGAEVQPWGTVPPREGPYPSILLWGREPSILSVWREGDHHRRLPRWVQVGGPQTEGPHIRIERPLRQDQLKELLLGLVTVG